MDFYLTDEIYDRLVVALLALKPCAFSGEIEPHDVRLVLGEEGGIWPARVEAASESRPAA